MYIITINTPFSQASKNPFSIAGINCLGIFIPTVLSSNRTVVNSSFVRGLRFPIIRPYCPAPPLCFL